MKAAVCTKYGSPEVLEIREIPKPVLKQNELLIRIAASAVNSGDVRVRGLQVEGFMKIIMQAILGFNKPKKPVLGTVLSGTVEETGSKITKFKKGDEVFAMTGFKFGCYAEFITLKESAPIVLKPKNATFEEAAAIIFGGTTAIYFLDKAGIRNPEKKDALIYGATGSVGTSSLQIAKYFNKNITAVCSTEGVELAKSLGAQTVIDYTKDNVSETTQKFDIIFDAVGKFSKKKAKILLKENGIYKTVGGMEMASETKEQLDFLKHLFDHNQLKPVIDRIYSLNEIAEAHRYVDTGRKKGNVVVKIASNPED